MYLLVIKENQISLLTHLRSTKNNLWFHEEVNENYLNNPPTARTFGCRAGSSLRSLTNTPYE